MQHFVPVLEHEHSERVADGVPVFSTCTEGCPGLLVQSVDEFENLMEEKRQQIQEEQGLRQVLRSMTKRMPTA